MRVWHISQHFVSIHVFFFALLYGIYANMLMIIVLVAGLPLDQKVVQYGPFVLNSQAEVQKALMDFRTHSNGFERAEGWESKIGKSMMH